MRQNRKRTRGQGTMVRPVSYRKTLFFIFLLTTILSCMVHLSANAAEPKSKFYDFSEQLIDGEIKRPRGIYTDARVEARFKRLLKLKRSFLGDYINRTARDRVFK